MRRTAYIACHALQGVEGDVLVACHTKRWQPLWVRSDQIQLVKDRVHGGFRVLAIEDLFMDQTYLLACLVSLIAGLALAYGFYKLLVRKSIKQDSRRIRSLSRNSKTPGRERRIN